MFGFGKSKEKVASPEAQAEVQKTGEVGAKRERPDFSALAQQRVEGFKQKKESRWAKIKEGFGKARDFVLTLDARTSYRAGQAKDATVEGAQYVGNKTEEDIKENFKAVMKKVKSSKKVPEWDKIK